MPGARTGSLGWCALLMVGLSCTTNHDQLAKRPQATGGTGGSSGGVGGGGSGGSVVSSTNTSAATGSGGTIQYLPDGSDVLTLVHGQVDAARIAFCFAESRDGERHLARMDPVPESGLRYGAHLTLTELGGLDLTEDSIVPVVLAGEELAEISGMDCEQALAVATWVGRPVSRGGEGGAAGAPIAAGGAAGAAQVDPAERPALRAMELPTLPAGALVLGRHYVMVVAGCMGGPGVDDDGLHCGAPVSAQRTGLTPVLVPVSRAARSGVLALQFMHASPATGEVDLRSQPRSGGSGVPALLSFGLRYGFIQPSEPRQEYSIADLGAEAGARVEVWRGGGSQFEASWSDIVANGRLRSIQDGESYLLVLLGPSVGTSSADGFNTSALTLVPTGAGRSE